MCCCSCRSCCGPSRWETRSRVLLGMGLTRNKVSEGQVVPQVWVLSYFYIVFHTHRISIAALCRWDWGFFSSTPMFSQILGVILLTHWDSLSGVGPLWYPVGGFHTKPIITFHLWCMLGGSVWLWMKSLFIQTSMLFPILHHKLNRTWEVLYAKQPTPDQKSCWVKGKVYYINFKVKQNHHELR